MKIRINKSSGMTLIEVLIAVTITSIMMLAMFSTYTMVNKSHKQVTNRAKISQSSRDIVGFISRDIFRAALFLASTFLGVVGLFILLFAEFLAAVQLIIYVGAISVVILYAIMFPKYVE